MESKHIPIIIIAPIFLRGLKKEVAQTIGHCSPICAMCDNRFTHEEILVTEYEKQDIPSSKHDVIVPARGKKWVMVSPCCYYVHIFGFDYDL